MKIRIDITDKRLFSDVAHVVDQDVFIEEVCKARKLLNISEPWDIEKLHEYKRTIFKSSKSDELNSLIESIRTKLLLPKVFKKVVESSIFLGSISTDDYTPAILMEEPDLLDEKGEVLTYTYSIMLSPKVKDTHVITALQEYRDQLGNEKGVSNYQYIPEPIKVIESKSATMNHRAWYWLQKEGKSISEILDISAKSCPLHTETRDIELDPKKCTCNLGKSTVSDGIDEYKLFLKRFSKFLNPGDF